MHYSLADAFSTSHSSTLSSQQAEGGELLQCNVPGED